MTLTDRTLAIKIDVERYERQVLAGMARTLRDNRGIVQIEGNSFGRKSERGGSRPWPSR